MMITRSSRSKIIEKHKQETKQRQKENRQQERAARRTIAGPKGAAKWSSSRPSKATAEKTIVPQWATQAHRSHTIQLAGGLIFCSECGGVATAQLRNLRRECFGETKKGSKSRLAALLQGKLPKAIREWPDDKQGAERKVEKLEWQKDTGWRKRGAARSLFTIIAGETDSEAVGSSPCGTAPSRPRQLAGHGVAQLPGQSPTERSEEKQSSARGSSEESSREDMEEDEEEQRRKRQETAGESKASKEKRRRARRSEEGNREEDQEEKRRREKAGGSSPCGTAPSRQRQLASHGVAQLPGQSPSEARQAKRSKRKRSEQRQSKAEEDEEENEKKAAKGMEESDEEKQQHQERRSEGSSSGRGNSIIISRVQSAR